MAYSHFRYDMDHDDDVLYCYEIQTEQKMRRKGLGRTEFLQASRIFFAILLLRKVHDEGAGAVDDQVRPAEDNADSIQTQ